MEKERVAAVTLVELLVAISIVAILVVAISIAFPKIRELAQDTKCISNLRTVGLSVMAHAADNGGRVVLAWAATDTDRYPELIGNPQVGLMWYQYLHQQGYLSDLRVLACPSFPPFQYTTGASEPKMQTYALRRLPGDEAYQPPVVLSRVEHPASLILLADSSKSPTYWKGQNYYFSVPGNAVDMIHPRHHGRANLFFVDGSLRALTEEEILDTDKTLNLRIIDHTDDKK